MPNTARVLPIGARQPRRVAAGSADVLGGRHWAVYPERLKAMRALAQGAFTNPQALTAWADAPAPDTFIATQRDGIATVRINDVLTRTWSFWSYYFGGATYEILAHDLTRLRDDAGTKAIILSIDSPGGEVAGCGELQALIRSIRAVKPIVAHAAGLTCSAAYGLGSAARDVIADPAAIIGSIGTCATYVDATEYWAELGVEWIHLVSSQSPRKNADPATEAGRADIQAMLDELAAVFISDIAGNRGTDPETVLERYGQGAVMVGQRAVDAGMADGLGTHDAVHHALLEELERADSDTPISAREILMARTTTARKPRATRKPSAAAAPTDPKRRTRAEAGGAAEDDDEEEEDLPTGSETAEEGDDEEQDDDESGSAAEDDDEEEDGEGDDEEEDDAEAQANARAAQSFAQRHPGPASVLRAQGAATERARLTSIDELAAKVRGPKGAAIIAAAKTDPTATFDSTVRALITAGVPIGSSKLDARAADESQLQPPSNAGGAGTGDATTVEGLAAQILTAGRRTK